MTNQKQFSLLTLFALIAALIPPLSALLLIRSREDDISYERLFAFLIAPLVFICFFLVANLKSNDQVAYTLFSTLRHGAILGLIYFFVGFVPYATLEVFSMIGEFPSVYSRPDIIYEIAFFCIGPPLLFATMGAAVGGILNIVASIFFAKQI